MFVQQNCQKTVSVYLLDCWDQVGRRCDSEATSPSHLHIRKWGTILPWIIEHTFKIIRLYVYFLSSGGSAPDPHISDIDSCEEFHFNHTSS